MHRFEIITSIVAGALLIAASAGVSQAQVFGDAQRGATVARSQCADCHGVELGQRSRNSAAPTFEVIAATSGMTGLAIEAALQTTHRQMPNVMLESADRTDIVAYIQSLKDKK
jgi:mono/diheme cytochrome c family protein